MRAAVLRGGRIGVERLPDPQPGTGQLLIAPHAAGICGSDLHLRESLSGLAELMPDADAVAIVPGHEFAGEVVAVGPGTDTPLSPGELVTAIPFSDGAAGVETIGMSPTHSGGLAALALVDASRTFRLPEGVDTTLGALCEPVAVALHAFVLASGSGPVVVVGAGPIGMGIATLAVVHGRHPIIAIDPSPARREMALRQGVDAVHAPGPALTDVLAEIGWRPSTISPLLDEDPVTATVFECVGLPDVVRAVLADAPAHSRIVLAGACTQPVELDPLGLTMAEATVEVSFAYRPHEFRAAALLLQEHPERFGSMITSVRSLEETAAAFDALAHEPEELKILIRPQAG